MMMIKDNFIRDDHDIAVIAMITMIMTPFATAMAKASLGQKITYDLMEEFFIARSPKKTYDSSMIPQQHVYDDESDYEYRRRVRF